MKRLIIGSLFFLLVACLGSACAGGAPSLPTEIPSPGQPEAPVVEPYPGPVEDLPMGGDTPADQVEPYPAPTDLVPVEEDFFSMPTDYEYAPAPGDEKLTRGNVFLGDSDIRLLESYPVQVQLQLNGSLPTPCHQLRAVISPPDEKLRIAVEVYSLTEPDVMCLQVLEPFDAVIPLGAYTHGSFTVWVNGEQVESFDLP